MFISFDPACLISKFFRKDWTKWRKIEWMKLPSCYCLIMGRQTFTFVCIKFDQEWQQIVAVTTISLSFYGCKFRF